MRLFFRFIVAASVASLFVNAATAQNYPSRPVKMVVPYPAGGSNDIIVRLMAQKLAERTGQNFLVENRAGAGVNVGAEAVASAEPDGYTLLLTAPPPLTIKSALYKSLPFDPAKAFAPVALIASVPIVLVVHPSLGVRDVKELVAFAKAKPGTINFGSSGIGTTNHLAGELLKSKAGIDIVHVPYKGAAPAMNDLLAGHIPMMFDNIPAVLPQVQGKAINAIAVAGSRRAAALPDVPTVAEQGVEGFDASAWFGLVAPAKTPAPVLTKLQAEVAAVSRDGRREEALHRTRRGARRGLRRGVRKIPRRRNRDMERNYPRVRRDGELGRNLSPLRTITPAGSWRP